MSPAPPRIGIDRFVDADWMELAAAVVRQEMSIAGLHARLAADIPGVQVQRKTIGIINRMWFPQEPNARELTTLAAAMAIADDAQRVAAFDAVAILAYPYFRQVVETLGRLLRLQGSCTSGEVHRRMFEQHGKRTTIDQATSYCFKTLVSWKMIERSADQRIVAATPRVLNAPAKRLLDRAANLSRHSVTPLQPADPLLFPFRHS
ncbi:MAG: hypothetical protein ACRYFY_22830 [Janthinobacterium lividum]